MSDPRASAPWERIRSGLRILAVVWCIHLVVNVATRLVWAAIGAAFEKAGAAPSLVELIGVVAFVSEMAFGALGVTLAAAASRLTSFPPVLREVMPADPYRGARDAGPARDPWLDRLAIVLVAALGTMAGLGVAGYVLPLEFPPDLVDGNLHLGLREALWTLHIGAAFVAYVVFTIWASRAARAVSRPLSPVLTIASLVGLALYAGLEGWEILTRFTSSHPAWTRWCGLTLEALTMGALIALALGVRRAIGEQPRSEIDGVRAGGSG